jgi:hypothetical protein
MLKKSGAVILGEARNLRIALLLLLVLAFASAKPAPAQGCAQCRETLGQTPIRTQLAYRRAITVLVVAGATIFTASFIALKKFRS